ncbi:MAG: Gfo/Idh/MocA family oxidoreductase [Eubacteriales bacterium]|nr:Gfo/Idh/MocA family oxidoreductase [Eubacteriales bacterium]
MKKVKWGVLGTASIARGCTIPGMQQADNCELYGVAGRDLKKAEDFKETFGFEKAYGDYDALLADSEVEAVYIPLPNHLHYEWCMKAIAAGKHVLCEKPLAPTKKQAEELFQAAAEKGVVLMEAFAYLHSPYVAALKEELDQETIGEISYIESAFMVQSCKPDDIRMYKEMYGGALYDLGCYCVSLMVWLLGNVPEKAQAIAEYSERNIDLFTTGYMMFPGEIRASFNCGMIFGNARDSRMDRLYIHGSKGYIKSDVEFNQAGELSYTICVDGVKETKTVSAKQNYSLEVEQLGKCITEEEQPHVSSTFSVKNAEVMDLVLEAIGY